MSDMILGFPGKYIQGPGALARLGEAAAKLGQNALVMADPVVRDLTLPQIVESLDQAGLKHHFSDFGGECCRPEIDRITTVARSTGADMIIAVGGGKALDTGKAIADQCGAEMISVPTIASTDGPVSSLAVEYNEDHVQVGAIFFKRAPSAVIVDSQVVANAPPRLLSAGMGDGLATWYEARACAASGSLNLHGGRVSQVGLVLARMCADTILEFGAEAHRDVSQNTVTEAVERVIEANVFLSGVGFENTGVAGAHGLDGGLTRFRAGHTSHHGERVAVGILLQLTLEEDAEELARLKTFYSAVSLPQSLSDLGLEGLEEADLTNLAELILRPGSTIHNMPMPLNVQQVAAALATLT